MTSISSLSPSTHTHSQREGHKVRLGKERLLRLKNRKYKISSGHVEWK